MAHIVRWINAPSLELGELGELVSPWIDLFSTSHMLKEQSWSAYGRRAPYTVSNTKKNILCHNYPGSGNNNNLNSSSFWKAFNFAKLISQLIFFDFLLPIIGEKNVIYSRLYIILVSEMVYFIVIL